jgi:hypothetical protein
MKGKGLRIKGGDGNFTPRPKSQRAPKHPHIGPASAKRGGKVGPVPAGGSGPGK